VRSCRVTTPRLGGKFEVDRRMRTVEAFADLLIPTTNAGTVDVLMAQLAEHDAIVVKPIFGALGRDVIFIARDKDGYRANVGGRNLRLSEALLREYYAKRLEGRGYLIQKYIVSRTRQQLPFDTRVHVRRNGRGEWELVRIWGRIGSGRDITSNTAAGGSGSGGLELLGNIYGADAARLYDGLLRLADSFPPAFQSLYPDRAIDALGLDVGFDPDGKPWLFEVNVYPSAQWCEIEDAVPRIGYALYLANNPDRQDGAVRV
jgi:glutathione synthase/RimK-type ligase-like ATP-grasp enzyme